jgi:hypothetical protein
VRIGICFNSQENYLDLCHFLDEYFNGNCQVDNIFEIKELIDCKTNLDILFLEKDAQLDEGVLEHIKKTIGEKCRIITSYDKNRKESFIRFFDEISFQHIDAYVHFNLPDSKRFIKLKDIIYITQVGRMVILCLRQETKFKYCEDLASLLNRINNARFCEISSDKVVNFDFIKWISKNNLMLKNGDAISIDESFLSEFENKYYKHKYVEVSSKSNLNQV